jgi:tartrate/fumarate subfamily iron-sulfur-dependent hydro-lyase alpha chain
MLKQTVLQEAIYKAIIKGSTYISDDVYDALNDALIKEKNPSTKVGLENTIKSLDISRGNHVPACPDTGWPLFFFKIGNEAVIEGGILALEESARTAVRKATEKGYLRRTMKHPLSGFDPGDNIGTNIPWFTYKYVPGTSVQVTYVAKGGGSEVFGGTQSRMVAFADGTTGIKKFIIDAFTAATYAGAICPPSILGIGIGGTANIAADLAKEAAVLRRVSTHHPEPEFRKLEEELYSAINSLGIGTMGAGGETSVLSVNVEYAYTHIAGIAVAISCNCFVARRGTYLVKTDGSMKYQNDPDWFGGR